MLDELHLFGVYVPAALVWAVAAGLLAHMLRNVLQRQRWFSLLGHPGMLELAFFTLLWWGMSVGADTLFYYG